MKMKAYIEIQRQRKNALHIFHLKDELRHIEGIEEVSNKPDSTWDIEFSPTYDKWKKENPVLKVRGFFNLSLLQQKICSNKYSVLRTRIK